MLKIALFVVLIGILFSCIPEQSALDCALYAAGNNREELEKVLAYYKNDSLKHRAACFLITNMPYHFYYDGEALKNYSKYFECFPKTRKSPEELIDSLQKADGNFYFNQLKRKYDILDIDSAYLVQNIDWAFKVWEEQPWGKAVSFADFCEYILPYRVGDELLSEWRQQLYEKYNTKLDSVRLLSQSTDPLFVAQALLDTLAKDMIYFTGLFPKGPHVGPKVVEWRSGNCKELADIVVYVFRALGVPCGIDYMVMRGDNNAPHFWNFVLDKDGKTYVVEFPNPPFKPAVELWNPKAKVYRETYSMNTEMVNRLNQSVMKTYPSFRHPLFLDETNVYAGEWSRKLVLPNEVLYSKLPTDEVLYLCLSCRDEWIPVDWTHCDSDSISFTDVEGDVICRLATWNGKKLQMCSDPFLFEKFSGNIRYFRAGEEKDTIALYFKYHLYNETFIFRMPGGAFEGSNDIDFAHHDTLFLVTDVPERLNNTIYVNPKKKYRYVRYKGGKDSFCNIAEVAFFADARDVQPLHGKVIGTPGCFEQDGSHEYTNVFDGDPYTSFNYMFPSTGWAGLDLGKPCQIEKIVYVPRNRDNFIRKGDIYELFYWGNREWISVGCKKAPSDSLLYTVPQGSLLYLKNHTRGKDERIFEYLDGKQRFW